MLSILIHHMKKIFLFFFILYSFALKSQIVIDNTAPNDNPVYLIDSVLLGGGVTATNHIFQGEPSQIGWFDAINTNLGIDSGIVLCTGDVYALDPINPGGFPLIPNTVTDPDLLAVANSVPPLLPAPFTNSFVVADINDVAILEFDFIPTSDTLKFRYAFGSQEYHTYENTQFNDVFGFFLSGPGIAGPWSNGAINLATVPNTNPPLPITISSINSATPINQQYFVDNQGAGLGIIADADGFTTVLTAEAIVQCGETYHIKLAIADGSDSGLSSYVWLEAGSFYSPPLSVVNNLSIDSTIIQIPCNSTITLSAVGGLGATYEWFDIATPISFSSDSFVNVGEGQYVVSADILGCAQFSDTLTVISDPSPVVDLGANIIIPCNSTILIDPIVSLGTPPYNYSWSSGESDSVLTLVEGNYSVIISDFFGCFGSDTIEISYDPPPSLDLGLDLVIACNTNTTILPNIIGGTEPYTYEWNNGSTDLSIDANEGNYILTVTDFYGCSDLDEINITEDPNPSALIYGGGSVCDDGNTVNINFSFNGLLPWDLTYSNGSATSTIYNIPVSNYSIPTSIEGSYSIISADDVNDCIANISSLGNIDVIVNPLPNAIITPNDITIYPGSEVEFNVGNYMSYEWYTEEGFLIDTLPFLNISDSGRYKVLVVDENGCVDVSELATVRLVPLTQLFIPTVFTPNDDNNNELFVIKGLYIREFNIKIYNRWGEQLFESDSLDKYWDGSFTNQKVPKGTYYYQIEVLGDDGRLFTKSGNIEVLY